MKVLRALSEKWPSQIYQGLSQIEREIATHITTVRQVNRNPKVRDGYEWSLIIIPRKLKQDSNYGRVLGINPNYPYTPEFGVFGLTEKHPVTTYEHIGNIAILDKWGTRNPNADIDSNLLKMLLYFHDCKTDESGEKHPERYSDGHDHNQTLAREIMNNPEIQELATIYGTDVSTMARAVLTDSKERELSKIGDALSRFLTHGPLLHGMSPTPRQVESVAPKLAVNDSGTGIYGNVNIVVEKNQNGHTYLLNLPISVAHDLLRVNEAREWSSSHTVPARTDYALETHKEETGRVCTIDEASRLRSLPVVKRMRLLPKILMKYKNQMPGSGNLLMYLQTKSPEFLPIEIYTGELIGTENNFVLPNAKDRGRTEIAVSEVLNTPIVQHEIHESIPIDLRGYQRDLTLTTKPTIHIRKISYTVPSVRDFKAILHRHGGNLTDIDDFLLAFARIQNNINDQLESLGCFKPYQEANIQQIATLRYNLKNWDDGQEEPVFVQPTLKTKTLTDQELLERLGKRY